MEGAFLFEAANHLGKPIRQGANPFALPHDRKFNGAYDSRVSNLFTISSEEDDVFVDLAQA
ncbi:hypothetical protein JR316_0011314 [Psilocybe cubensis]|uniref:Uncharacterized protein n=1 Tax=Psilocybe cubensis TaxID=181762 RepID=A0ACB8GJX1_PSICU|nr:hypothetical protein JR316_0011314 [Psilocybe cubensis]KAH9475755.1 hypothetical protein JR316_0011314 [Psilocybe cubensis]